MYNIGQRVRIKKDFNSNQTVFVINIIDFNKLANQTVYSGTADNGNKVRRVIEGWLEPV